MKLEQGDAIERIEAEWIRSNIPIYEYIWASYIGNDGFNRPVNLATSFPEFESVRDQFNECHYSILISLLILRGYRDQYAESLGEITNTKSYLNIIRDITGFMSQMGRLRDLFKVLCNCVKLGDATWLRFDDFYKSRNAVVHGSLLPIWISDGFVNVPPFETASQANAVWSSKSIWSDCQSVSPISLCDYMDDVFKKSCELCVSCLSEVLTNLKARSPVIIKESQVRSSDAETYIGTHLSCGSATFRMVPLSGVSYTNLGNE